MSPRPKNKSFNVRANQFFSRRLARPVTIVITFMLIGSLLAYLAFAQQGGTNYDDQVLPPITANPALVSQSCLGGLYISLLADNSGSIGADNLVKMQDAFRDFVSSLLPSTKTMFAVSRFAGGANVLQGFTNNVTSLNGAISQFNMENDTNWTAGLQAAYGTFSGVSASAPKLLIIATDGDPTSPRETSLSGAVAVANQIKAAGIHILAVGIGKNVNEERLQKISGTNVDTGTLNTDVMTSDFDALNTALQNIARYTCSGNGTGGSGNGTGGSGNGTGGTGNGNGTGGTGTGSNGNGTGTTGNGTGTSGTGKGNTGNGNGTGAGTTPSRSPNPQPTAANGVTPSPAPTNVPDQQPTPAPTAIPTPEPTPTPAPTPMSQGTKTRPPQPQPSPFYDGKEYAPGSTPDDFVATKRARSLGIWLYAIVAAVVLAAGGAGYWFWWRKKHAAPAKLPRKSKKL